MTPISREAVLEIAQTVRGGVNSLQLMAREVLGEIVKKGGADAEKAVIALRQQTQSLRDNFAGADREIAEWLGLQRLKAHQSGFGLTVYSDLAAVPEDQRGLMLRALRSEGDAGGLLHRHYGREIPTEPVDALSLGALTAGLPDGVTVGDLLLLRFAAHDAELVAQRVVNSNVLGQGELNSLVTSLESAGPRLNEIGLLRLLNVQAMV